LFVLAGCARTSKTGLPTRDAAEGMATLFFKAAPRRRPARGEAFPEETASFGSDVAEDGKPDLLVRAELASTNK
jgi:hypothetical protein